jgi:hypothetical protein
MDIDVWVVDYYGLVEGGQSRAFAFGKIFGHLDSLQFFKPSRH